MKIFCHVPRENWVVDRMGLEYSQYSSHEVSHTSIEEDTEVIWLLASWCWNQIPINLLENKKVVCTIHHEVPWKMDKNRISNFRKRDKIVDQYLTYTEDTKNLIHKYSNKDVTVIPHWVNDNIWKKEEKEKARLSLGVGKEKFLIGSFQRDTEGSDLITPKLEKGPDIFLNVVKEISKTKNIHVLLSGWRRQYIIKELENSLIPYTYVELPSQEKINSLYNALDLYVVSSRCEGGPQALFECAYLEIPIISTSVGQSNIILDSSVIYDPENLENLNLYAPELSLTSNKKNINKYKISNHIKNYDNFLKKISTQEK
jgi:glycosyltransferase involved in cell wall biosynthesis